MTEPPLVSVSGTAEIKVPPDEIQVNVGVETRNEKLQEAKNDNDAKISSALKFLKEAGIPSRDIQTDFLTVEPLYESQYSRTKPVAFVVQKNIGLRLRKVGEFERVLTGLLTNGVNFVHGITFRTSELRKHRDAARQLAVRAAVEKADALAKELGVNRGRVYRLNESYAGGWQNWSGGWRGGGGNLMFQNTVQYAGAPAEPSDTADGTLSVGLISLSATISASFLIE